MANDAANGNGNVTVMSPDDRPGTPGNTLKVLRESMSNAKAELSKMFTSHMPVERFIRTVDTAVQRNPDLLKCTPRSLFNAAMQAATDGLLPDGRDGAIVAYSQRQKDENGRWFTAGYQAQWMVMIGGLRKKVRNSGEILTWDAQVVYEEDDFDYQLGDDPFIKHKPKLAADGNRGKIIAAYSIATLKGGEKSREVMSIEEIEAIRARSKSPDKGPWGTDYSEMCRKTVARRHSKVLPMSTDLDDLIRRDDELYNFEGTQSQNTGETALLATTESRQNTQPSPKLADKMKALAGTSNDDTPQHQDPAQADVAGQSPGKVDEPGDNTASAGAAAEAGDDSSRPAAVEPSKELLQAAWDDGVAAKARGGRRQIPAELRAPEREAEYEAWVKGYEGESLE